MRGHVHRVAQSHPHIARRIAGGESIRRGQSELVQNHVAHEGAAEVFTKLSRHGERKLGMLHRTNNSEVTPEANSEYLTEARRW